MILHKNRYLAKAQRRKEKIYINLTANSIFRGSLERADIDKELTWQKRRHERKTLNLRTMLLTVTSIILLTKLNVLLCGVEYAAAQEDSLLVVSSASRSNRWIRFTDAENSLYRYLSGQVFECLGKRAEDVAKLKTADQWRARQSELRAAFDDIVGPFPEKTPLNSRVTGIVRKDGYRVEKVVYESMPGYHVTAALFVPDGLKGKSPAVLFCIGHSGAAFRRPLYQHVALNLVKKGFVVLAIDPVGQGGTAPVLRSGDGGIAYRQLDPGALISRGAVLSGGKIDRAIFHLGWDPRYRLPAFARRGRSRSYRVPRAFRRRYAIVVYRGIR